MSSTVQMRSVTKSLGGAAAVDNVDLDVEAGEFFSILGPSGCGKTTTLRMLAGFLIPDSGTIHLGGTDVTHVPPYHRDVNTVFQSYALFGHLNVADNVAFGLKRKRVPRAEIARRVADALDLVSLRDRATSKPSDLSGGQRQRVALARALVNMPKLLLLDEPLGALDLQLRRQMQSELKRIQRDVGITFVFVTHDQEEALAMSDRIAVMRDGRFEQIGAPADVYDNPESRFVASFIGRSNVLDVVADGTNLKLSDGTIVGSSSGAAAAPTAISIRPEKLSIGRGGDGPRLEGTIADVAYFGVTSHYVVTTPSGDITVVETNSSGERSRQLSAGDPTEVSWRERDAVILSR